MSLLERLLWEDPATADEFQNAEHVSVSCPFCGAAFEGKSTQRVFECPSCGNKIGVADLLKPGTFSKRLSMGTGAEYIPEQALPCRISAQQACANALALVRQHPDAFAGHDVDKAIEQWRSEGRLPAIRDSIKRTKALDWLVENAQVTIVDEAAEAAKESEGEKTEDAE